LIGALEGRSTVISHIGTPVMCLLLITLS
jgi:hypothetical protein